MRIALAALALLLPACPLTAATVYASGTLLVQNSLLTNIPVGDRFHFVFSYDDSVVDTQFPNNSGYFSGALLSFSLTRDPANTGSWDPSGGTVSLPGLIHTLAVQGFQLIGSSPTGFPNMGPDPLSSIAIQIGIPSFNDNAPNLTLAQHLGGPLTWNSTGQFSFNGDEFAASGTVIAFSADVPEPASAALAILGLALVTLTASARRRSTRS